MKTVVVSQNTRRTIFVAFSGLKIVKNYHDFDFKSFSESSRFVSILLRDKDSKWYTSGVSEFPSLTGLCRFLRRTCKPYDRIVFIGSSMGGFAALLYGHLVSAHMIIAFSQQTVMTSDFLNQHDKRWSDFTPLRSSYLDLSKLRVSWWRNRPAVSIFCSASEPKDILHAERFLQAHDYANIIKVNGADHALADALRKSGHLRTIVENAAHGKMAETNTIDLTMHNATDSNPTNVHFVKVLYQAILKREPSADDINHCMNEIDLNGIKSVVESLLSSPEYGSIINNPINNR